MQWLLSIVTGPFIKLFLDGYKAKLAAGNDQDRIVADLAGRELDVQAREKDADTKLRIAQIGHWYEPEKIMGYTAALYFAKIVVWDTMLGLGVTGELKGWAAATLSTIIMAYFGKRGVENVARILTWRR
jgi:hypothetical protein